MQGCKELFVAIAVQQWEPMVKFYRHLLQQSPQPHIPNSYAEFMVGGLKLGLFLPKASHQPEFSHPAHSAMSLCLEVENLEQSCGMVDAVYDELYAGGYGSTDGHGRYGLIAIASHGRECYAYDPDGNRLILHEAGSIIKT